jgi:hypothetical protein
MTHKQRTGLEPAVKKRGKFDFTSLAESAFLFLRTRASQRVARPFTL